MNTEKVSLSQVSVNENNPRTITDSKFQKLITSILALPKMLNLRPIVVDNTMVALGGNMRYRALLAIEAMEQVEIAQRLSTCKDYTNKTDAEQQALLDYWAGWKAAPTATIIKADELTEAEKREFIIKDNVGFGDWDMDELANKWDTEQLNDWGLDLYFLDPAQTVVPTEEPTENNFNPPERQLLECPNCHHKDESGHFKKVSE